MSERRYQAGRPYFRPPNKHGPSAEADLAWAMIMTFIVGAACGATVALMGVLG